MPLLKPFKALSFKFTLSTSFQTLLHPSGEVQTTPPWSTRSVNVARFYRPVPSTLPGDAQHFSTLFWLLLHVAPKISESCQPQLQALPSVVTVSSKISIA